MNGGFGTGKSVEMPTGTGMYSQPGHWGSVLPDESDLTTASTGDLVVTFCTVMDSITRSNNTSGLAELSRYAGQIWWEMTGRGVEFK